MSGLRFADGLRHRVEIPSVGRERVRGAELVPRLVSELAPELVEGPGDDHPADLAIPAPP